MLLLLQIAVYMLVQSPALAEEAESQPKVGHVNLEDIKISGEVNRDGSHFDQRSQFDVKSRIKFRSSFLDRIEENGSVFLDND